MRKTLRWLESLKQVRYQLIAHDFIGHLLLDLGLNEQAVEQLECGLALGRNTGIMFWRAAIDAGLAVARSRLGQKDVAPALAAALERTRRSAERYLMVRCIDALAELALAAGDTGRCRAYADELLALAEANGLRELEAGARRWRGEALLRQQAYAQAQSELSRAAALAQEIGRVRLQMDAAAALARLFGAQGQSGAARRHDEKARAIAQAIETSVVSSGLEARLGIAGNSR
jgi:tetratricopeptide (TPR) repeat protein